jgi:hypothetical protein
MKIISTLVGLSACLLVVGSGCGKPAPPPAPQVDGVTVDLPKLNEAFVDANRDLKTAATMVGFNIRYKKYEDALMALDKLANDPAVTEPQKKIVNDVIEQVKKLAGAAPAAAPAQ